MWENIKHEQYKAHDIRSSPVEVRTKKRNRWKVRIDITFPPIHGTTTIRETFDEEKLYSTLSEAHTAAFQYGRGIIDKAIQKQSLPTSSN